MDRLKTWIDYATFDMFLNAKLGMNQVSSIGESRDKSNLLKNKP